MKKIIVVLTAMLIAGIALAAPDIVFQAMTDELHRTMDSLTLEGMSKPYFAAYRVIDIESYRVVGEDGAVTQNDRNTNRLLSLELRVGNPAHDNSWFIGSPNELFAAQNMAPVENEYGTLRHQLWMATDKAYKNALENLGRKSSYYQSHPDSDTLPDFSSADTTGVVERTGVDQSQSERDGSDGARTLRSL